MRSKAKLAKPIVALLVIFFAAGIIQLLELQFDTGSAYVPWSSFRPDPQGTKVLYDSLTMLPELNVWRNVQPLESLPQEPMTLLFLGAQPYLWIPPAALERAASGSRVVIAFAPVRPLKKSLKGVFKTGDYGVTLERRVDASTEEDVDDAPPRESALYFDKLSPEWKVRRTARDRPVAIERTWKRGTLVLLTDSYALSNEALAASPDSVRIAWLVGLNKTIVFDETHHGLEEAGSVVGLMRRYRLHGLLAAVIVLGLLFIWSRAMVLLPELEGERESDIVRGRSSAEGLLSLLERSIAPSALIDECVREWSASAAGRSTEAKRVVQETAEQWKSKPVEAYDVIRRQLEKLSHPWKHSSSN